MLDAHPDEHQHGVSIQISINLRKTFLRISRIRNIRLTWILARVFAYLPLFISQILDFIYWTVLIFILIYFEIAWHWKPAIYSFLEETSRPVLRKTQNFTIIDQEEQKIEEISNWKSMRNRSFMLALLCVISMEFLSLRRRRPLRRGVRRNGCIRWLIIY